MRMERAIIQSILLNNSMGVFSSLGLVANDFSSRQNSIIYTAFLLLDARKERIDLVTLVDQLLKLRVYDQVGTSYLTSIFEILPDSEINHLNHKLNRVEHELSTL